MLFNMMIVMDEVDKKCELKWFVLSVFVLKDCMNFGCFFNVVVKCVLK